MPDVPREQKPGYGETVTVEEMLRRNGVEIKPKAANAPPSPSQPSAVGAAPKEAPPKNGAFMKDGKWFYRYEQDGEVMILPKPIEQMTEQDFYDMPMALVDNTIGRLPTNLTVKFKDPQWAGYWFNKKANGAARVGTGKALGFVSAKIEDLEWYPAHLNDKDGALEQGDDLILMKIPKWRLYNYYKQAQDRARRQGGVQGYKQHANSTLPPSARAQDPFYLTPQATQEYSGVGEVAPIGEGGRLITQNR
jgi:hypothetical protein